MRTDPGASGPKPLHDGAADRLRQLADILGCPVTDFFEPSTTRLDLSGAVELIGLWNAATDEAARARLLGCVRMAAARHEDWPAAAG